MTNSWADTDLVEVTSTAIILISSAAVTGALHTLIPDHWLPFVLVGRVQRWDLGKTLFFATISAIIHVGFSIGLGLVGFGIGVASTEAIGEWMETGAGISLVVFGLLYALWGLKSHGGVLHIGHSHGSHGIEHELEGKKRSMTGWGLALLMGLNPCILALPIIASTVAEGTLITLLTSLSFGLATVFTLVGLTALGVLSTKKFRFEFLSRYGEVVSGLLIFAAGLAFIFLE